MEINIIDATHLWGKNTLATTCILQEKYSKMSSVISIGPAGENHVLFASVITDGARGFGRGGIGALWGYKKIKAIVVKGRKKPNIKDRAKLKGVLYEADKSIKQIL